MRLSATTVQPRQPHTLVLPRGRTLQLDRPVPLVMGVLNVTPDSFSDGGRWVESDAAIAHGLAVLEQGADVLDIGAESTRPGGGVYGDGAREVSSSEELDRLLPVLEGLRATTDAPLSVDTRKAAVAEAALAAGADVINDISALSDPGLGVAVADAGCPIILMHSRGALATMQTGIGFNDVVAEVSAELAQAVARAMACGVEARQIVVDPGIGFG
ncbi:MAG: dihydropteroate synthase, partial [Acidobacteriota bacterium]|nr:dihydropteroate synthase [Acidobacteriota bacterium]